MRTGTKVAIGVGAAVVAVGVVAGIYGPGLYADWASEAADDEPTLEASMEALSDTEAVEGTWTVGDGSFAGYRVDEVLQGADVTVTGRTEEVTGDVTVADGAITAAGIEVDMASVATDEARRDEYFRDQAMEVGTYPTALFELTAPAELEPGATAVELTGDLTIHGVTQPATVEAEVAGDAAGGGPVQVIGSVPITFADFGVEAPDLGFVSVEDEGSIEFSLQLESER
ncbi:YceI family protein [Myceligenerans pegani]|uniref:YceI family protein n=1 Tax=Myceligenerans pegani TaxID=2776917 RepID=A0ABR9N277_9MICO|nr:YceI family protein [Myceligenerans sp. TRM 65318]MBE1877376.1 YceI family protein [Myceligenerans sp. TRM 65318]MBE3019647.1 YceI family protein [Myceligenerans sp. TRM 65318]